MCLRHRQAQNWQRQILSYQPECMLAYEPKYLTHVTGYGLGGTSSIPGRGRVFSLRHH
jgi:hypothetical protein